MTAERLDQLLRDASWKELVNVFLADETLTEQQAHALEKRMAEIHPKRKGQQQYP